MGDLIPLSSRTGTVTPPPAPNPDDGVCTTWGQLCDHMLWLVEEGEWGALRRLLMTLANVTAGEPLPAVFATDDEGNDDV